MNRRNAYRRRVRGVTLIEALIAAFLTAMTLTTAVVCLFTGASAWANGQGKINAEEGSHTALRLVVNDLRQAMAVSVDSNGLGVTYTLPAKDSSGAFISPAQSDGVVRRIELDGTTLNMITDGVTRKLCDSVILTDPLSTSGTTPYQIFTAGAGTTTRSVTVMIVTKTSGYRANKETSRNRETVFVRNVPPLNQ
ncbi:MAG TPA: hypothetical protein VG944_14170 [Fimbriimonas sp.]|nr:hypothetical protein [Fimbriimonas sp.]